jgi:hypothetical protein
MQFASDGAAQPPLFHELAKRTNRQSQKKQQPIPFGQRPKGMGSASA